MKYEEEEKEENKKEEEDSRGRRRSLFGSWGQSAQCIRPWYGDLDIDRFKSIANRGSLVVLGHEPPQPSDPE